MDFTNFEDVLSAIPADAWASLCGGHLVKLVGGGGSVNVYQGADFENKMLRYLKRKYPNAVIETQHRIESGKRPDIVFTTNRGRGNKYIVECKDLRVTKLCASHVDQVVSYREELGGEAWLVTSPETRCAGKVEEYAKEKGVKIFKLSNGQMIR